MRTFIIRFPGAILRPSSRCVEMPIGLDDALVAGPPMQLSRHVPMRLYYLAAMLSWYI
jgi:hypothetical protein